MEGQEKEIFQTSSLGRKKLEKEREERERGEGNLWLCVKRSRREAEVFGGRKWNLSAGQRKREREKHFISLLISVSPLAEIGLGRETKRRP